MYKEIEASAIKDFVCAKMREIDEDIYNDTELDRFFNADNRMVVYEENDNILAFCGIIVLPDGYKMCYTWCSDKGKRAYAEGIDYMIARYNPMFFGDGALKLNKIKRITQWIDKP